MVFAALFDVRDTLVECVVEGIMSDIEECNPCQQADHADDHTHSCALLEGTHTEGKVIMRSVMVSYKVTCGAAR